MARRQAFLYLERATRGLKKTPVSTVRGCSLPMPRAICLRLRQSGQYVFFFRNAQVAAATFIVMATIIRKKQQKKRRKRRLMVCSAELCLVRCEADSTGIHLTHSSERDTFEHCSKTDKHTARLTFNPGIHSPKQNQGFAKRHLQRQPRTVDTGLNT
ncbi:hypothetical protein J6590_099067 [Homalodisca vitripennis]|nr:hypothetical protein J6590_099067 [Homalodisca vitripennis]